EGFYASISVIAEAGVTSEELQGRVAAALAGYDDLEVVLAADELAEQLE
ncbi:MAG: hypothetical protein GWN79_07850, partial [Actinobacteria bacterium]|nr:hypothetical protein [Actinomycetota bacterium]NIS30852.1 hypothetical protein [Actinomycetota bacterium]NIT95325.1 hypothetical protein [Actinomycetota bacterium]NIU19004.1 hypothetical protein [Actinomycetota bacterium]NIU66037.1 hypothetical protein [Actinomycetota bacterium]